MVTLWRTLPLLKLVEDKHLNENITDFVSLDLPAALAFVCLFMQKFFVETMQKRAFKGRFFSGQNINIINGFPERPESTLDDPR